MQSKLITLVLTASLVSLLLTGLLSFGVARHLLAESGLERLTALRNARSEAIKEYTEQLSDHVMTLSETRMTIDGIQRFSQAFNQLPAINEEQKKRLRTYYDTEFIPKLKKSTIGEPSTATYLPSSPAEGYLKYHYTAANDGSKIKSLTSNSGSPRSALEDAKDGSNWSSVHKEYHRRFARLAKLFGYQDIVMVDVNTGNVVYNISKEDDLGTNLLTGPYADSAEAKVFREVKKSRDPFFISFSDFENYKPSFGKPTMFVGTSVFDGDNFVGVLIFQLSNERIDNLMTSNRKWRDVGMGSSGETYLVGQDNTFRSSPRFFLENPKQYLKISQQNGLSQAKVDAIKRTGTPVLIQPVKTTGALSALAGKTGTDSYKDYRGVPVVASYQPIRFGPFEWGLLAKIDQTELYSGIRRLARNLLLLAALLIPAITLLTLWMAKAFIQPIRRLLKATEKISSGEYNIRIPVAADDEFGDLASAFNAMSDKLSEREESLKEQVEENQRLLLSILPGSAASRLQEGSGAIAETHPSVSVLFAEIEGWNDLSQSLPAEDSIRLLNELTRALDATVERFDVEKLQDVGTSYLAVSGLSRPRIDHEKRAVDCALTLLQVMRRFNQNHDLNLSLDIGLHAGPLTTGVVQGERLSFDIWGKTINIARGIHESPKRNVIQVSAPIVEALRGLYIFKPLPAIAVKGLGELAIWEVVGPIDSDGDPETQELQEASR
ncbi:MAG: adenylate/guanylate cyclase domain-containing protein [Cyanobacteriota bacterium]|nr:adenylate/guanylate cyclase domain-containing protein [Cyanobacteriota bacterium]